MQIHEVTNKKLDEGLLDMGKAAWSAAKGGATAYKDARMDQRVAAVADKAYKSWATYKKNLDKFYAQKGKPATPAEYEKALMSFVQKNLLGGQQISSLTTKDDIVGLVKQIAGSSASAPTTPTTSPTTAPADTTSATAPAADATATAPAATAIEKGAEVAMSGKNYRWLGAQWAEVNPSTGKAGKTAEKGIVPELNKMATAGQFAKPQTGAGAGAFGAMANTLGATPSDTTKPNTMANTPVSATNKAKTAPVSPYTDAERATHKAAGGKFDGKTGKMIPVATTGPGVRMGEVPQEKTPGAINEPISIGGKKLDPKRDAALIAKLKSSGQLQEAADPVAEKKLFMQLIQAVTLGSPAVDPNAPPTTQSNTAPLTGKEAKSTGNPEADKILAQQGFTVK